MNQKKNYYISAFILYLNYFIHGIGCSVLGQVAVKETLVSQWGISDIGKVTMVAAALGLGRLIALPFAGPLSDKLGRRIASLIGILSYIIFFLGLKKRPLPQNLPTVISSEGSAREGLLEKKPLPRKT